jgi:hypothetical protein
MVKVPYAIYLQLFISRNQQSLWIFSMYSGRPDWPGAHPASCTMGISSFLEVKSGRGMTLTLHPLLMMWSWKSRAIHLLPQWAVRPVQSLSACTVELYLYSHYGPYGLYRASVPVQGCTLPLPLLVLTFYSGHHQTMHHLTYMMHVVKKFVMNCGQDSFVSWQDRVVGSCKHGN